VFSFLPLPLYNHGKFHQYLTSKRLGGHHSQSRCFREEEKLLSLPEIKPQFIV
jgi:hypothetical protein